MNIRVWNALLMPTVRSTKPNPDEQIPVALAARIVGIDRSSLAHLVDHGLVPRLDLEAVRSEEHTSELQSRGHLVCRLLLEKKKKQNKDNMQFDKYRVAYADQELGG